MTPSRSPRRRSARPTWFVVSVAAVAVGLAVAIALAMRPGYPRKVVIATGFKNGSAHRFAQDYRAILARHGVTLELRETRGGPENLALLEDPRAGVAAAFLPGGLLAGDRNFTQGLRESIGIEHPDLVAVASVFHEPLWVFHRLPGTPRLLSDLAGKRVAIGGHGTATLELARRLLPADGLPLGAFEAHEQGGRDAVAALAAGRLDAVVLASAETAPLVGQLAAVPGVRLLSLDHADALARRFPWLARLSLPRGGLDLAADFPSENVALVSPTAALVVRRDLHPAIVLMLAEAAVETHGDAGTFQRQREFPSIEHLELPIDPDARRYVAEGPSFLNRLLPFALATVLRRLSVILPAAALLFSLLKYAPRAYEAWVSQRIYRWYGQLRTIEDELARAGPDADPAAFLERVDRVDDAVSRLSTPTRWSDRTYTLRQHIDFVREQLERHRRRALERHAGAAGPGG